MQGSQQTMNLYVLMSEVMSACEYEGDDEYARLRLESIRVNEKNLQRKLQPWLKYLDSPQPKGAPWLDQIFAIKPKLANDLFKALYSMVKLRNDVDIKIVKYLASAADDGIPETADSPEQFLGPSPVTAALLDQIDSLNKLLEKLVEPHKSNQIGASDASLLVRMNEYSATVFKRIKNRSLRFHTWIQITCLLFLLLTTGFMTYFYLVNQRVFFEYFISCVAVAGLAIASLAIDYVFVLKEMRVRDRLEESKMFVKIPDSAYNASEHFGSDFEEIPLDDSPGLAFSVFPYA